MGFFSRTVQVLVILLTSLAFAQTPSRDRARDLLYAEMKPENPAPVLPDMITHGWGRALLWAFEFIDFSDMIVHIAQNDRNAPSPWVLYDNDVAAKKVR